MQIRLKLFGENHSFTAQSYQNLAIFYEENMKDLTKAGEYYQKSLQIKINLFGENHSDTAMVYSNLSIFYEKLGEMKQAQDYAFKAFNIISGLYGKDNYQTKQYLNSLMRFQYY